MRIFSSPSMLMPAFDKTVFVRLKDQLNESSRFIKEMQGNPYQRDVIAVNQFFEFLKEREKTQPFFSYIHLDSAHAYCALNNVSFPFQPVIKMCNRAELTNDSDPAPYFNRYKNALKLDDQLFQKIVNKLQNENLLANTIVIVTGDHGEEFNDGHHDYWSHASNYTKYQTQTPLIVYWPGEKPKMFKHLTSHYDLVPTLLKRMFGCTNFAADYSVGKDLLDSSTRPYLLIDGYIDFGVVENDRITRILSTGDFQILDTQGLVMPGATLRMPVMNNVFSEIRKFYQ